MELRTLYLLILAFLMSSRAFADQGTITVDAPSTVEAGDQFRVRFTINSQDVDNFAAPDFKGFEVIYGPATSRQSSYQFVNGKTSHTSSITYTYVLVASKPGTYTLGAASAQVGGATIKSRPMRIHVERIGSGGSSQSATSQRQGQQRQASSVGSIGSDQLFMTATASRTNVYEQEAILLTYKLYTTVNLTQLDGHLPSLDGFQIQEIALPHTKEFHTEKYRGRNYQAVTWTQYVLFPQKSGRLTIPSVTFEGVVVQPNRNLDPIDMFFNGASGMVETKKKISTPEVTINVKALPEAPSGFSGAVGEFELSSSLGPQEVKTGDAITLKLHVKGRGNMKLINTPEVKFPKDFERYDPKVTDNFSLTTGGLSGTRTFEYLAVPHRAGQATIPAVEFIYFDPSAQAYRTLRTESYALKVAKGKGGSQNVSDYSGTQADVKELGRDIRYIHRSDTASRQSQPDMRLYLLAYLLPVCAFVLALVIGRKRIMARADIAHARGKKATKVARRRLKRAAALRTAQRPDEFYEEVLRALYGYAADKYNLTQEHLNKDNLRLKLAEKGVDEALIDDFLRTITDCEFARFAGGTDSSQNMSDIYAKAVTLITHIENQLK